MRAVQSDPVWLYLSPLPKPEEGQSVCVCLFCVRLF
jgi:hypothetical protein